MDSRSGRPWTPSTATRVSPGLITFSAGIPFSTAETWPVTSCGPIAKKNTHSSTNATSRLTAGPAAITTIRFQTGCEW